MILTTGEQLREVAAALKQDQRNYLHEVMQGQERIAELEAELAEVKGSMAYRTSLIGRTEKERNDLKAELAALKDKAAVPVAYLVEGLGTVSLQYKYLPTWAENDESLTVTPLYAAPAQPGSAKGGE